ncbi:acetyl-CoA synthetase-like protein [Cutaneotrichosporon oleaginosum]|uniref:Acetyl-CoA synthetase-like protein n=1 Tax=Cutaneotrichosporon oleaginosum TaxID=879819 RepID=A0A0J0XNR8_9TREE|nr:acetyl-CoA synthetase-like protein [Cutaneotrichosporon oleaginosum]KLT42781.1 acetyl-CoA synthetase-like protein [Cutaneotrichosporon oleaginosum]TXT08251.1 hypothetical protein COLE_05175 [Cutaneotrichosporon oleaginosum]
MSSPVIYTSEHAVPALPRLGLFQYLFPAEPVFDSSLPAFIDGIDGREISRAELEDEALRLASGLRALGMQRGDTACIWGLNSLEWVRAAYGCLAAGIAVTPANFAYEPTELAHQLNNSGAKFIFVAPDLVDKFNRTRPLLERAFPDTHVVLLSTLENKPFPTRYRAVAELFGARGKAEKFAGAQTDATTWMCYSSGTTGLPKGVETTHWNLTSQLQACAVACEPLGPGDKMIAYLPLSHIYGTTNALFQPLSVGAAAVILPRFEETNALRAIEKYRVKHGLIVPPIVITLYNSPNLDKYDLSCLRSVCSAAAPLGPDLIAAFEKRLPSVRVTQCYGLSETSPLITALTRAEVDAAPPGSIGRLLPTFEARIVDADGHDVPPGERGELWVRSPSVMKGYHRNAAATAATMAGDYFKTGDVVVRSPDGYFRVVDRVKELIKYKGFQVPPAELEALLLTHPRIADAAVVGVYDASQATELPTAYVTVREAVDAAAFDQEIQEWVAARVARHKRLGGGVFVIDQIPKSAAGKLLRRQLRDRAQADRDARKGTGLKAKL